MSRSIASSFKSGATGLFERVGTILRGPKPIPTDELVDALPQSSQWIRPIVPPTDRWHTHQIQVAVEDTGRRLTDLICRKFNVTVPLVRYFISRGQIQVSRAPLQSPNTPTIVTTEEIRTWTPRQNLRLEAGDLVVMTEVKLQPRPSTPPPSFDRPTSKFTESQQKYLQSLILYKDDRLLVLNKPFGLAMHDGPGIEQHLAAMLEALREANDPHAPLLVHRLDRDTTGALLLARDRETAAFLAQRFREAGTENDGLEKVYWALAKGSPPADFARQGEIVSNIYRRRSAPGPGQERMTSIAKYRADLLDEGVPAITRYRYLHEYRGEIPGFGNVKLSLWELCPQTGRTHQLRVHLAEQMGLPVWGDYRYFNQQPPGLKMHLHCRRLTLPNWPVRGQTLSIVAPLPDHFNETQSRFPYWNPHGGPLFT